MYVVHVVVLFTGVPTVYTNDDGTVLLGVRVGQDVPPRRESEYGDHKTTGGDRVLEVSRAQPVGSSLFRTHAGPRGRSGRRSVTGQITGRGPPTRFLPRRLGSYLRTDTDGRGMRGVCGVVTGEAFGEDTRNRSGPPTPVPMSTHHPPPNLDGWDGEWIPGRDVLRDLYDRLRRPKLPSLPAEEWKTSRRSHEFREGSGQCWDSVDVPEGVKPLVRRSQQVHPRMVGSSHSPTHPSGTPDHSVVSHDTPTHSCLSAPTTVTRFRSCSVGDASLRRTRVIGK